MVDTNGETKEIVTRLAADIHDLTMAYSVASTPKIKEQILQAIEIKAMELKAFIKNARDNDAI
jgi:hypothetical protein